MSRPGTPAHSANGGAPLHGPGEVAARLGRAPATLRLWSNEFADLLSVGAQSGRREGRRPHRRYSIGDVEVLSRIKTLLDHGLSYAEVRRRLGEDPASGGSATATTAAAAASLEGLEELEALRERLPRLPSKQYRLAQALLKTPEIIMFGSVREVASQLDVNNATIIRFAQSLGYSGYQALQSALRQAYLPRAGLQPPRDAASRESPEGAVGATLAQHEANLRLARQHLLAADLDGIGDALVNARRIVVSATGSPIVPATLLVRLLRHVGLRGELVPAAGVDRAIGIYDIGPGDVVVGIGFWLTFRGVAEVLALARRRGATTIAITGSPTSPLAQVADHLLIAPAQGAAISFSAVTAVAVVEALIAHVAGRDPGQTAGIEQRLHDLYLEEELLAPLLPPTPK